MRRKITYDRSASLPSDVSRYQEHGVMLWIALTVIQLKSIMLVPRLVDK